MQGLNRVLWFFPAFLLMAMPAAAQEQPRSKTAYSVEHVDPISIDPQLSLAELVDITVENYPDVAMLDAMLQEADAIQRRGSGWLANSPYLLVNYIEDGVGSNEGVREITGGFGLPLWHWGQRDAVRKVADRVREASGSYEQELKWKVAGLVRDALWTMALADTRLEQAQADLQMAEKLLEKVQRRVEYGDLPRSDTLLAESNVLEMRSGQVQAEAEVMHSRKRYAALTKTTRVPSAYSETQNAAAGVSPQHPALNAVNGVIERKKAEIDKIKISGTSQPNIELGGRAARGSSNEPYNKNLVLNLIVPIGGNDYVAPQVAAANLEMTQAMVNRDHLVRDLEQRFHEAEHALEVDRAELAIAEDLKKVAEAHLRMEELSFAVGESNLLDLLKIQSKTNAARRYAKERALTLKRDMAFYNQAVGAMP